MRNLKNCILLLVVFFSLPHLQAQEHNNMWMRATLSIPLKKRFKIDTEVQHRRQNGFENNNLFDQNLTFSFKNWIHYQHNPNLKFSVSPFAYYSNYAIINTKWDEHTNPKSEVRFSAATEIRQEILEKLHLVGRTALEYRIYERPHQSVLRFRNRLSLQYEFSQQWKAVASMEVLVNLSGVPATHFLDHNRFGGNLEYHPTKNIKLQLGYLYISRLTKVNIDVVGENIVHLNVAYQLKRKN